jgi:hypothetical protein
LLSSAFGTQQPALKPPDEIEEDELREHLTKQFECEADQNSPLIAAAGGEAGAP